MNDTHDTSRMAKRRRIRRIRSLADLTGGVGVGTVASGVSDGGCCGRCPSRGCWWCARLRR
jgi:hypothetical protein